MRDDPAASSFPAASASAAAAATACVAAGSGSGLMQKENRWNRLGIQGQSCMTLSLSQLHPASGILLPGRQASAIATTTAVVAAASRSALKDGNKRLVETACLPENQAVALRAEQGFSRIL